MIAANEANKRRALIIGGSLGGLFAGNLLRRIGWDIDIFERSPHDLDSRGGGIVLQPEVIEVLRRAGVDLGAIELGVRSAYRTVFRPDGSIQSKHFAPQTQTSWSLIYSTLKAAFGDRNYHQAKTLLKIDQDLRAGTITAQFEDGTRESGDLLIGADGGNSIVRQQFWPTMRPTYAGYLAWRGLLPEDAMPLSARETLHGDFGFANNTGSHILGYLVPGEHNDVRPGHRLYNWVWYRVAGAALLAEIMTDRNGVARGYAVPEGLLADKWIAHLHRGAQSLLPSAFRQVVEATAQPFAQAIRDLAADHIVHGRVVISETPPRSHGPTPRRAPPRQPPTLLPWRPSCRPSPTTSPRRSLVGSRARSRSANTSASRDRRQATICCSTDRRSRGSGERSRLWKATDRLCLPVLSHVYPSHLLLPLFPTRSFLKVETY